MLASVVTQIGICCCPSPSVVTFLVATGNKCCPFSRVLSKRLVGTDQANNDDDGVQSQLICLGSIVLTLIPKGFLRQG